jgi:deoxyadenosine/deoxycytidine kinase
LTSQAQTGPRVEISGGIGAGKTTLARSLGAPACGLGRPCLVEEEVRSVPFFAKFYAAPALYAFEKNVSFLLSHGDLIREAGAEPLVCDFALFQDLAYTDIACARDDVPAVEGVYRRVLARTGPPSLLIHLLCTPDAQLERIARRGRPEEAGAIGRGYLEDLCGAIDRRRRELLAEHPGIPVVEVDTDALDTAGDPAAVEAVRARVLAALPGFDPGGLPAPSRPSAATRQR